YAEGLIDKGEFEPRVTRLRQRLARLEEQRQALADEAAVQGELQLIIGRLEDFAAKLHDSLETADWASKRALIRALVKRVEVARNEVNVVFRIDPYPGDNDPEKKSLQLCRGRDDSALRCSYGCIAHRTLLHDSRSEKHPDQFQEFLIPDTALQESQHELVV